MGKVALIVDELMEQITTKKLLPGAKLPSENQLADKYKVPRFTIREAFNKLEERGYIYSEQGKGRYLKEESVSVQMSLSSKTSFTEKMNALGYDHCTQNISCTPIDYDPVIYETLSAEKSESVYQIGRLRLINGEPIAIHYSYVKEAQFPSIGDDGPAVLSMFRYYRAHGIQQFSSRKSLLNVTFPTSREQKLLHCGSMVPLIEIVSDSINAENGNVLEYTRILYRSDKFKYDITSDI
ncbi:GntR family transcriptional regulator [Gracilibacillus oryzae]|nr:GntR family transcriptional regulator [Gracilibacillus oryzae]